MIHCDAAGCHGIATECFEFRGQIGHVHVCPADARIDREFSDVTRSTPLRDGECPYVGCSDEILHVSAPTPL